MNKNDIKKVREILMSEEKTNFTIKILKVNFMTQVMIKIMAKKRPLKQLMIKGLLKFKNLICFYSN